MNKVINASKVFQKRAEINNNSIIFYCIECIDKNESVKNSQLISVYDLDNDGILRVGMPSNPFTRNMFFGTINQCRFLDKDEMERLQSSGKRAVQIRYFHAFNSLEDLKETGYLGNVIKVVMNHDQVVTNYGVLEHSVKPLEVKKKAYK